MMRTHALIDYMKVRADVEEAVWDLPDEYFEELFDLGVRSFYGVQLNDNGILLNDSQEPFSVFLGFWKEILLIYT